MIQEKIALKLLNRSKKFFSFDFNKNQFINKNIKNSKIIVIGGAGSIGFSVISY